MRTLEFGYTRRPVRMGSAPRWDLAVLVLLYLLASLN
jgi:hypothetical protein